MNGQCLDRRMDSQEKIAAEDHHDEPPGNTAHQREREVDASEQHFVGDRIEVRADGRDLTAAPGEESIEAIRERRAGEQHERECMATADVGGEYERREKKARHGQQVRDGGQGAHLVNGIAARATGIQTANAADDERLVGIKKHAPAR